MVVDAVRSFGALKCESDDMMRNVAAIRDSKRLMGAAVCAASLSCIGLARGLVFEQFEVFWTV